jgi:hypothetical protein
VKLRLWPQKPVEPPRKEPAAEETPAAPEPVEELPGSVSLTVEEAKAAIRGAGVDVIQVGFLALALERLREEDPASEETGMARERLCELVAKRLKDCKQLAPEGSFVLLEAPGPSG